MPSNSNLNATVLCAREHLAAGRDKLRAQHQAGTPGVQLCASITQLLDGVILDLYEAALAEIGPESEKLRRLVALVPYGGYGRADVAPFSDVDLLLLHPADADRELAPLLRKFTQNIYDSGLELGFSPRTPADACAMALKDVTIFTSLAECRLLSGNSTLYEKFFNQFGRMMRRRSRALIELIVKARRDERRQFGETNYLLEPNIKRSRGGLRDLQYIRWIGYALCGEVESDNLVRVGLLSKEDHRGIQSARNFLLQLRNELHFHAGKAQDILTRHEQIRIAGLRGFAGSEGMLPVEQFMREYFRHTSEVRYVAANFAAIASSPRGASDWFEALASYRIDGDFRVGPRGVRVVERRLAKVARDPEEILRLMELANLTDTRIEHRTWGTIRDAMLKFPEVEVTDQAKSRFLALLAKPTRIGELLRRLHELRVLERLIPPMAHARCLLQFNEYHKFTVDEHSIRAVEIASDFRGHPGMLGVVYDEIRRKDLLHLALLIHDLGKGYVEDHSEVGRRLARDIAGRFSLSAHDTEILEFLVHKHLLMSHLAQRRDINDPRVIVDFAVETGSPEVLKMMFVLTCADLAAVGPDVLNDWKLGMLTELYQRTLNQLGGNLTNTERISDRKRAVRERIPLDSNRDWWERQIESLPYSYLVSCPTERIHEELSALQRIDPNDAVAWHRYLPDQQAVEYTIGTNESIVAGIFHRLTGVFSSKGMQILSAEINTLADGFVIDRFFVTDGDFRGEPDIQRVSEVKQALVDALKNPSDAPPAFRKVWSSTRQDRWSEPGRMPSQVRIDCTTSERFTIIDVFTHDRMGLLYAITRTLFQLGLSVGIAKIGTHLDQVVDVFYVTDFQGAKVTDEQQLQRIRDRVMRAIAYLDAT